MTNGEIVSVSKKMATLEMKELNERQRAEHAQRMYEQLRDSLRQVEQRNFDLENKFVEVSLSIRLFGHLFTFTFSHLADAFIQSDLHMCDLQCIHILHFTLMAHCTSGAIRGSVSCSRTLQQGIELATF